MIFCFCLPLCAIGTSAVLFACLLACVLGLLGGQIAANAGKPTRKRLAEIYSCQCVCVYVCARVRVHVYVCCLSV